MKRNQILFLSAVIFYLLLSNISSSQQLKTTSSNALGILPLNTEFPSFKVAHDHVGIVTDKGMDNRFILFDSIGNEVFTVRPASGMFMGVIMSSSNNVVLVAGGTHEDDYASMAYDYRGHQIFPSMKVRGPLRVSPDGRYYYTINNPVVGNAFPQVFDNLGKLLVQLNPNSPWWEQTALNDSMLLFQDGNILKLLAVPGMALIKEIKVEQVHPPEIILYTAVDSQRRYYAFEGRDNIAICNLESDEVSLIPKENNNELIRYHPLAFGPNADYLICFNPMAAVFTIYAASANGWNKVIHVPNSSFPSIQGMCDDPIVDDRYCIFNYYSRGAEGALFQSILIDFGASDNRPVIKPLTDGYIFLRQDSVKHSIWVFRMDSNRNAILSKAVIEDDDK